MARKIRIQFPGAIYHVINRGNYRHALFAGPGEAQSFLDTVKEAKAMMGWRLYAYVLMHNHYHLALETPEPNLVEGMHWLQSTWATRFNRFRRERGHLFQGRYQSLLIEDAAALGKVVDYIHLNPIRAKIVPPEQVKDYQWSSLAGIVKRTAEVEDYGWQGGGRFGDESGSGKAYGLFIEELGRDEARWEAQGLTGLSKGWAIGSSGWKRSLAKEYGQLALNPGFEREEVRELREGVWEGALKEALAKLGHTEADMETKPRLKKWKIQVAKRVHEQSGAPLGWLAARLQIGEAASLRSYLYRLRLEENPQTTA